MPSWTASVIQSLGVSDWLSHFYIFKFVAFNALILQKIGFCQWELPAWNDTIVATMYFMQYGKLYLYNYTMLQYGSWGESW